MRHDALRSQIDSKSSSLSVCSCSKEYAERSGALENEIVSYTKMLHSVQVNYSILESLYDVLELELAVAKREAHETSIRVDAFFAVLN